MIDVSVSQLVNEVDKSEFTLYAEWENTHFRIILLRSCTMPLSGEMHIENANYFLHNLEETFETYLEKTRDAFSGKDTDVQFFLQDDEFKWIQETIQIRGRIRVGPLSNVLTVSDTLKQLAELYQRCQEGRVKLEEENEVLINRNAKLITELDEIINKKKTMEKDLYAKFILLLNAKKRKIRELQEALDNNKPKIKSVYDESTDEESGKSDMVDETRPNSNAKSSARRKRVANYKSQSKTIPNSNMENFKGYTNSFFSKNASPEPSTSKVTLQDVDMCQEIESTTISNIKEENSDDDMFLNDDK
ncbi:DNA repair protein XRCC4-like [Pseudomyrmex gracilis]|uniref:DNA repair protein XRCC4-like n=1 Tax=Pseudomyrmex gracilis TaxID=219809 RepID=UPI000995263D|nr:DNA repair protein XRCC4-like [Pseudomyrmex gracilis]